MSPHGAALFTPPPEPLYHTLVFRWPRLLSVRDLCQLDLGDYDSLTWVGTCVVGGKLVESIDGVTWRAARPGVDEVYESLRDALQTLAGLAEVLTVAETVTGKESYIADLLD